MQVWSRYTPESEVNETPDSGFERSVPAFPRQRAARGGSFLKRLLERDWFLKTTTAVHGELTFGNPFQDAGVVPVVCVHQPFRSVVER